ALLGQSFPDSPSPIQSVVQGWKLTMDNVTKFLHDRVEHANKLCAKGKLREAYQEFALVAPFKGPEPEKARAGLDAILTTWKKLRERPAEGPAKQAGCSGWTKGDQKHPANLDCAKAIADQIAALDKPKPAAAAVEVAANKPAATAPADAAPPPA